MFVRNQGESLHTTRAPPRPGIAAQEPEHQRRLRRRGGHTQRMAGKQQRKSRDTRRFRYPCYPVVCVNPWSKEHGVDHQGADGNGRPGFHPDCRAGCAPARFECLACRTTGCCSRAGSSSCLAPNWFPLWPLRIRIDGLVCTGTEQDFGLGGGWTSVESAIFIRVKRFCISGWVDRGQYGSCRGQTRRRGPARGSDWP